MLYPIKFKPILFDKIWGGNKIKKKFRKIGATDLSGESWEISGIDDFQSTATNDNFDNKTISELIDIYKEQLLGNKVYKAFGNKFPLLFKWIDANDNLSIQVHPGDILAKKRHNSLGKTEMWYVVDAEPDAEITVGFSEKINTSVLAQSLEDNQIEKYLHKVKVQKGDTFFIPAGLIHAIGKGILIAEIQQNSDVTYRIYDYNRIDQNGEKRTLHIDNSLKAINFNHINYQKETYLIEKNKTIQLAKCEYFTTNLLLLDKNIERDFSLNDSFIVYMCAEGKTLIKTNHFVAELTAGQTILIPACIQVVRLEAIGFAKLLETFIE